MKILENWFAGIVAIIFMGTCTSLLWVMSKFGYEMYFMLQWLIIVVGSLIFLYVLGWAARELVWKGVWEQGGNE